MRVYNRVFGMHGCKLNKPILGELWKVLNSDASTKAKASASTLKEGTKFETPTLDELWMDLDDPNHVTNIELKVTDPGPNDAAEDTRYSSVSFEPWRASVNVSGPDETWVLGRAQQIEKLLQSSQRKLPGDPEAAYSVAGSVGAASALLVFFLWLSGIVHGWLVLGLLLLAGLAISVITWRWWRRRNTTEIVLADSRRSLRPTDAISLVVAILSLGVAVFQTWGQKH